MLTELFHKLREKIAPVATTPLDSLNATHKWVNKIQQLHEYEAHQQVVILLDEFNRTKTPFDSQRLHILAAIEHIGSKLQHGLITQFLKNHADYKYAGKSLWQEITAFYWQLAQAYQNMTQATLQQKKSSASILPTLVLRALHYQGKLIQWRYLRYEPPTAKTWYALHKLYKISEQYGFSKQSNVLKGSAFCSCEQAYSRILLLHLMRPVGLKPNEIELAAYWAWKWREAIALRKNYIASKHSHFVALSDSLPPQALNAQAATLESTRYWSIQDVISNIEKVRLSLVGDSTLIKLYGVPYEDSPKPLLRHINAKLLDNTTFIDALAVDISSEINICCGTKSILAAFDSTSSTPTIKAGYQAAGHPGEAYYRLTVAADITLCQFKPYDLLISLDDDKTHIRALMTIRWLEASNGKSITLGVERLCVSPQLIQLFSVQDPTAPSPFLAKDTTDFIPAIIEQGTSTLISFHHMKHKYYDMREGNYIYRIRIQELLEQKHNWLKLQFVRLSRRYQHIYNISINQAG